jgi:hypothetical protein
VPRWSADGGGVRVHAGDATLPFASEVVSESEAFTTLRLAIDTDGHDAFELSHDGRYGNTLTKHFRVSDGWARPARTSVRVHAADHEQDSWTCSYTDAHFLTVTDAPAYRVQWATRRAAFGDGTATTIVVPHHTDDFWLWGDERAKTGAGRIGLGHLNCFGETTPTSKPRRPRFARVQGLWPDGSEGAWSEIVEVDDGPFAEPPPADPAPVPEPAPAPALAASIPLPADMVSEPPPPAARPPSVRRIAAAPAPGFDAAPLCALLAGILGFVAGRRALARVSPTTAARLARLADLSVLQTLAAATAIGAGWLAVYAGLRVAELHAALGFAIAAATWAFVAGAVAALARGR